MPRIGVGIGIAASEKGKGDRAPPPFVPSLKLNDRRNSQYIGQVI